MRPTKIKIHFKLLFFFVAAGLALYFFSNSGRQKTQFLQSGDIIFRKEESFWGDVASASARKDGKYSHAGVIYIEGKKIFVIHAYANTNAHQAIVSKESLDDFLQNASAHGYYRLNFVPEVRQNFAAKAYAYYKAKTPFDDKFSLADDKAVYCTELVWQAARQVSGYDIAPVKNKIMGKVIIGTDDLFLGGFMKPAQH